MSYGSVSSFLFDAQLSFPSPTHWIANGADCSIPCISPVPSSAADCSRHGPDWTCYSSVLRFRLPSGVEGVALVQVLSQRRVGMGPATEVTHLAANLLGPAARGVWEEREIELG